MSYKDTVIKSDDPQAIEKLKMKLEQCQNAQEEMKKQNAYFKKHGTMVGYLDLTEEMAKAKDRRIAECGFFESIPLWAVTLIGSLFITVLSFILILTVYGRFFKIYMFTALAPIPFSTFAGEPTQNVGRSFIKSYCGVLLEGAVIILACIIFSLYASSPPQVDTGAAAVTMVWKYVGELVFNMLVLVGTVKMSDRIIHEMMGM